MTLTLRMTAVGWGLFSLFLAFLDFTDLSMLGFPDGYITPYDMATRNLLEVLAWLLVAQSLYFLVRGLVGRKLRPASLLLQIAAAVALILVPIGVIKSCPRWDSCSQAYQAMTGNFMDDGAGG